MENSEIPNSVRAARWGFWILAVLWIVLGVLSLVEFLTEPGNLKGYMWVVAGLMFVNALVLVWLGWGIGRQSRRFLFMAVGYLILTIILTITDQFGIWDLLMLIACGGLLGLLLVTFRAYGTPEVK